MSVINCNCSVPKVAQDSGLMMLPIYRNWTSSSSYWSIITLDLVSCWSSSYLYTLLISAVIGILGAVYQLVQNYAIISSWSGKLSTINYGGGSVNGDDSDSVLSQMLSRPSVPPVRNILLWLSVANIIANIGIVLQCCLWIFFISTEYPTLSLVYFIHISIGFSMLTDCFYISTFMCTLMLVVEIVLSAHNLSLSLYMNGLIIWLLPLVISQAVYLVNFSDISRCSASVEQGSSCSSNTALMLLLYVPLALVSLMLPPLAFMATYYTRSKLILSHGRFGVREQRLVCSFRRKLVCVCASIYICWLPTVIFSATLLYGQCQQQPCYLVAVFCHLAAIFSPLQCALFSVLQWAFTDTPSCGWTSVTCRRYLPTFAVKWCCCWNCGHRVAATERSLLVTSDCSIANASC